MLANIKPRFGECALFAEKALTVNMSGSQMFLDPHGNTTVCVSTQSPQLANYLLIDVAQVNTCS